MPSIRVLVIEDDPLVRETLAENLTECGCDVAVAQNGDEGLHMLAQRDAPDVIITDIIMPHREGLETIIEIRKNHPHIKLIAISGGGQARTLDFLELAMKFGADAVLPKPLDLGELENTLRKLTQ